MTPSGYCIERMFEKEALTRGRPSSRGDLPLDVNTLRQLQPGTTEAVEAPRRVERLLHLHWFPVCGRRDVPTVADVDRHVVHIGVHEDEVTGAQLGLGDAHGDLLLLVCVVRQGAAGGGPGG